MLFFAEKATGEVAACNHGHAYYDDVDVAHQPLATEERNPDESMPERRRETTTTKAHYSSSPDQPPIVTVYRHVPVAMRPVHDHGDGLRPRLICLPAPPISAYVRLVFPIFDKWEYTAFAFSTHTPRETADHGCSSMSGSIAFMAQNAGLDVHS